MHSNILKNEALTNLKKRNLRNFITKDSIVLSQLKCQNECEEITDIKRHATGSPNGIWIWHEFSLKIQLRLPQNVGCEIYD